MPLIVPCKEQFPIYESLKEERVPIIDISKAEHQDIRPLRIGLLNLMPSVVRERTEIQYFRLLGNTPLQITPILMRFDEYLPERGRERLEYFYEKVSEVKRKGLDGLIISGANLERDSKGDLLAFEDVYYYEELKDLLNWSRKYVTSTIYSCFASHFALYHIYGIERQLIYDNNNSNYKKIFGVYCNSVNKHLCYELTSGMNDVVRIPHSRWGNINRTALEVIPDIDIIMENEIIGWHLAVGRKGRDIYLQGHPEYDRLALAEEYFRDQRYGQDVPINYFLNDKAHLPPVCNWSADASVFYRNWVNWVYQETSYYLPTDN